MIPQILLFLMIAIYFGSLWKIFEKAGRKKWEGFIPGYNIYVWLKIIKKPWWWIFFFIIPFVNLVVTVGCNVETARLFGKYSPKDTLFSILLPWYFIPFLAFDSKNKLVQPTDWSKKEDREKRKIHDHLTLFFIAPFVGHTLFILFKLLGSKNKPNKKTITCEWTNALGFAIVAASIIRTFFFEAFTIPTGSMEKTMRVGDYLFVNKMKYGAKLPQTPISIPFVHNRIPLTFIPSFVEWFKIEYTRLPGYGDIKRNDIMVFNWPVGDSVIVHDAVIAHDYYSILRNEAFINCAIDQNAITNNKVTLTNKKYQEFIDFYMRQTRKKFIDGGSINQSPAGRIEETNGLTTLPVDKKENYIKRCVGVGGDTLEIIDNIIHINGVAEQLPEEALFTYNFYFDQKSGLPPYDVLLEEFEVYNDQHHPMMFQNGAMEWYNPREFVRTSLDTIVTVTDSSDRTKDIISINETKKALKINYEILTCSPETANKLAAIPGCDSVVMEINSKGMDYASMGQYCPVFPNDPSFDWSRDNFGPLYIPKKGGEIELNERNWILYKRAIEVYEKNEVQQLPDGSIEINGAIATHYTFKQNYYWLIGDNRHGSADSRYWGFVPEDHVVGTASFIWFTKHVETGIRWDRIFSFVK